MVSCALAVKVIFHRSCPPSKTVFHRRPSSSFGSFSFLGFNPDIVEEFGVKWGLKSSIFVVQKTTAPKIGLEFRQGSIGAIRSTLAMLYDSGDVARRRL